jgi:glycosyltransferase involved in cell wall biosynthesis
VPNADIKKTIIFVATTPFAVNAFLRNHLLALSDDFNVVLCVNTDAYPLSSDLEEKIQVIHIGIVRKISVCNDFLVFLNLLVIFFKASPSAVHSITPKGGLLAMLSSWIAHVPSRSHTFTGQVWANKKGWRRAYLKMFDRLIVGFATRVFADSASQCDFLQEEKVVSVGSISVLGPGSIAGVDTLQFKRDHAHRLVTRSENKSSIHACVYLFVGRIVRDKGVFDLLDAFILTTKRNAEIELWIVGPDEEGLLEQLKAKAECVHQKVKCFGPSNAPENFMNAADILILPSYREGFGSVIIEAAACGIPAIAYAINGLTDAILNDETGLLVNAGNIQELSEQMFLLSHDKEKRLRLGVQAMTRVLKEYSSKTITSAWIEYFLAQASNKN